MAKARINEILVPSPVKAGIFVTVTVNIQWAPVAGEATNQIACAIFVNDTGIEVTPSEWSFAPNEIKAFRATFVMPNRDVVIDAYSMYYDWIAQGWVNDDTKTATVALDEPAPPPEEYKGSIVNALISYPYGINTDWKSIPWLKIPKGIDGQVHIAGRNDMSTPQSMKLIWEVMDPDNIIVDNFKPGWSGAVGPGSVNTWSGGRISFSKVGNYLIEALLIMNQSNPVAVDSYSGILGIVVVEPPPEPPVEGWHLVSTATLSIDRKAVEPPPEPPELPVEGWYLVSTATLSVDRKVVEPPPELPEEKEIPWLPILIGTGATVILVAALSKKKTPS